MLVMLAAAVGLSEVRWISFQHRPKTPVNSVAVVGQFNNWDKSRHPLKLSPDGKFWTGRVAIAPGAYQYLFVENGNTWLPDPTARRVSDANGNVNSLLIVVPKSFGDEPPKLGDGRLTVEALEHRPDRRDTVRRDKATVALWLRARKGDLQKAEVTSGERKWAMENARSDELYTYWRAEVPQDALRRYAFSVNEGKKVVRYPASRSFSQEIATYPLPAVPSWVQDAVFYQIFPDRFYNGSSANDLEPTEPWGSAPTAKNWMGGDLKGISDKLPHLTDLGITALYLNPIFESPSNHGYDTTDYFKINQRFGDIGDLQSLSKQLHGNQVHLILDGVFNHSGTRFQQFQDVVKRGKDSAYQDWFYVTKLPIEVREGQQTYRTFAGVQSMPKLNSENSQVRAFVNQVGTHWIDQAGIDGWRLDVADEVSHGLWRDFRKSIKAKKPDAFILGEVWGDAHEYLQGDEHDSVMNYRWRSAVLDLLAYKKQKPSEFDRTLRRIREDYPAGMELNTLNLLGSHDTERLSTIFKGNLPAQMAAIVLQFTYPGVPSIYYGDEIGLEGGRDPDDRRCMIWDRKQWNEELLDLYKELITLRRTNEALRRGSYQTRLADDKSGLFVFERSLGGQVIEVVLNTKASPSLYVRGLSTGSYDVALSRNALTSESGYKLGPYGVIVLRRKL